MDEIYVTYVDEEHVDNHDYDDTTDDDHDNNNGLAWSGPVRPGSGPGGTVFAPPEAIFYNFRIFSKNRFCEVFGGSWGPGMVLDRLGILKNPQGT